MPGTRLPARPHITLRPVPATPGPDTPGPDAPDAGSPDADAPDVDPAPDAEAEPEDRREVGRWFLRRGLGALVADTAYHSTATVRAAPALVVLFLVVMFWLVPTLTSTPAVSVAIVLVAVLLTWAGGNLGRGRRAFAPIERVGWPERVAFVAVPVLAVLISPHETEVFEEFVSTATENRLLNASGIATIQIIVLAVVIFVVNTGLVSVATFLSREVTRSFLATSAALARTLPLLLGVVFFFFFTAEMWQSIGRLDSLAYAGVIVGFVVMSLLFLSSRDHLDVGALSTFASREEIDAALAHGPFLGTARTATPASCPLDPVQERSLRLIVAMSRLVVAGVVALAVLAFFLVFAVATTNVDAVKTWSQSEPDVIFQWATSRHAYAFTWEQVRVSGFLAAFSGFYYAVVSATDPSLREGVQDTAEDTVREACAARLEALARTRPAG